MKTINKKGEIATGTIILILLLIGAVYVINHPPTENTIIIKDGLCLPNNIESVTNKIVVVNQDNVNYTIDVGNVSLVVIANSKGIYEFPNGENNYSCAATPTINGTIKIN